MAQVSEFLISVPFREFYGIGSKSSSMELDPWAPTRVGGKSLIQSCPELIFQSLKDI